MGIPSDKTSNRILIFFSCWCLLALPIHYFSCAVERNSIPALDAVLNKSVIFAIEINVHCMAESNCVNTKKEASHLIQLHFENEQRINEQFKLNINEYQYNEVNLLEKCGSAYTDISYLYCLQSISPQIRRGIGSYDIYLINMHLNEGMGGNKCIVSPSRSAWIDSDNMWQLSALMEKMVYAPIESSQINIGIKDQIFSFSLLNSEPAMGHAFKWNMTEIYDHYLSPFFNRLSNILIYDFYVDSQILYYGYIISPAVTDDIHVDRADFKSVLANYIKKDEENNYFYVTNKELQTFVGGTDWNHVSSLISDIAPIQFVIYIPPKKYSPLHIKSNINGSIKLNEYNAFLVPRFGGCIIYNPYPSHSNSTHSYIETDDLYSTFNLVTSQLRSLFGLRNDYYHKNENESDMDMLFLMDGSGVNEWELDLLIRGHIINDLQTVEIALKNIYAIIAKVSQLPIKENVALLISDAVYAFDEALKSCNKHKNKRNDADYKKCIQWTRHSNYLAQKAEYHPSMLPALYFSPEFTYAVYSPYFLPGYIPIVAALFKKIKAKCKQYTRKKKKDTSNSNNN